MNQVLVNAELVARIHTLESKNRVATHYQCFLTERIHELERMVIELGGDPFQSKVKL